MRNFLNVIQHGIAPKPLYEAPEPPETAYGYWIKPDGEFVVVSGTGGHLRAIQSLSNGEWRNYGAALEAGWVRVVSRTSALSHRMELSINIDRNVVSARAAASVRRLAQSQPYARFTVDVGPEEHSDWKQFDDVRAFLQFFNRARHAAMVESVEEIFEAAVPETAYGYWVDPNGNFIVVPRFRHEATLARVTDGELSTYAQAYAEGWVRVVTIYDQCVVHTNTQIISARAMSALALIAKSQEFAKFIFTVDDDGDWMSSKDFTTPGPFLAAIRSARSDVAAAVKTG